VRWTERQSLFAGVAIVAGATIVLQIALTRVYSALLGHHLAFLAISLSLFGVGLGGVLLTVLPALARPPRLHARLAILSAGMAITAVLAMQHLVRVEPVETLDAAALGQLSITYLVTSLPFVFGGTVIAAAIRHTARDISRLYLVDLAGAAAGGLGAIAALRIGAPRAGLVVAVLASLAALVFAIGSGRRAIAPAALLAALAGSLLAWDAASPWLRIKKLRWTDLSRVEFMRWNEMALITVDRPLRGIAWLRMDGGAATAVLAQGTAPPLHPDEMGYLLHRGQGPVLVIGAGGGRDVVAALRGGQTDIYAAEINPIIVNDVMLGKYWEYSGRLFSRPEVHVSVADGRSFVRSNSRRYRSIVISLVDTWAASSVGALSLAENSLYTVEAFRDFIQHLEPEGTLTVNRWAPEVPRLVALSAAGLRAAGATHPADHLFACSYMRTTAVLIKASPFAPDQVAALRSHCRRHGFVEVLAPDHPLREPEGSGHLDLTPTTDDRPFFFYTVPARRLPALLGNWKLLATENQGLATLLGLLVASSALAILFLLGPLLARRVPLLRAPDRAQRLRALLFFACLGAGYVFVELALVQHFVMFLGHPVYALSAVLVVLLLATGVGALLTARFDGLAARIAAVRRARLLAAALAVYALGLGATLGAAVSLPFAVRIGLVVLLLAPLGLLMGSQMPLGVKLVAARCEDLVPWGWGLNGVASVVATALATGLAMHVGFSAVLGVGAASYLLGSFVVPRAVVEG
jgi:hypothetical protein